MRCVTPMYREYIEYSPEEKAYMKLHDIKQQQRIIPREEVARRLLENPNDIRSLDDINEEHAKNGNMHRWQLIPCRNCYACQLTYSAEWATRIVMECKNHLHNYFVTLTYDDEHLPIAQSVDIPERIWNKTNHEYDIQWHHGENDGTYVCNTGTVYEEHIIKFLHDIRQYLQRHKNHTGMKYYYCAEYGELGRPHYHMILMNCPLDLKQFHDTHLDENHKAHWKSIEISKYWDKGIHDIAEVEWSDAAYVARYCMKKLHNKQPAEYAKECKLPEYVRMSRNIGRKWYEEHKDELYYTDELIMKTVKGRTGSQRLPKAWDRLYEKEHPEAMAIIKESRKAAAERSTKLERQLSDYTDYKKLLMKYERVSIINSQLPRIGEW